MPACPLPFQRVLRSGICADLEEKDVKLCSFEEQHTTKGFLAIQALRRVSGILSMPMVGGGATALLLRGVAACAEAPGLATGYICVSKHAISPQTCCMCCYAVDLTKNGVDQRGP